MSAYSDYVLSLNPVAYWRLNESSGPDLADSSLNIAPGTYNGTQTFGVAGATGDGDTAVTFPGPTGNFAQTPTDNQLSNASQFTINAWFTSPDDDFTNIWCWFLNANDNVRLRMGTAGRLYFTVEVGGNSWSEYVSGFDWTTFHCAGVVFNAGVVAFYIDGVVQSTTVIGTPNTVLPTGTGVHYIAEYNGATSSEEFNGTLDDIALFDTALDASQMAILANQSPPPSLDSVLPMQLEGTIDAAAATLPMRLTGQAETPPAVLGMTLEAPDPADYLAAATTFGVQVVLNGNDLSNQIAGPIDIEHAETESGIATIVIQPPAGPIDPGDYERLPITITFVGSGYTQRRFTGLTSTAVYDPDQGYLTIEATTNLQGQLENLPREVIDSIVGGTWSEHVFDDTADGWRYARDRLSTIASELHADVYGHLIVTPWAAKGTPDFTLTDAHRFDNTLNVTRTNLRDLITRFRIQFDFRFTRLRHREIVVRFADELGFCDWANRGWLLPSRSMVAAAADGTQWNRTSDITYDELPPPGTYCTPERGWVGDPDLLFCLGAQWKAARRWAQTITEEYGMDLIATDLEESVGIARINADYGVEATFDSTDYEIDRDFTDPPPGSVLSPKSFDWQIDADQTERDGRTQMEAAQEVAMEVAKSEILGRARKNRVSLSHIYYPPLQVAHTVRVNTPYLQATGKVNRLRETLDPVNGIIDMQLDIAVSRHDGSGLASDDPLTAPTPIEQPQEENTGRTYTVGYHIGGEEFSPPDEDTWDGYVSNVDERIRFPGANIYRTRFVLRMPEVETEARDALSEDEVTQYEVVIPQDELNMSA